VRVGVSDAVEDRMVLEEQLEAAKIDAHGDDEQQGMQSAIESPRQGNIAESGAAPF
jgi:hypothetical protein